MADVSITDITKIAGGVITVYFGVIFANWFRKRLVKETESTLDTVTKLSNVLDTPEKFKNLEKIVSGDCSILESELKSRVESNTQSILYNSKRIDDIEGLHNVHKDQCQYNYVSVGQFRKEMKEQSTETMAVIKEIKTEIKELRESIAELSKTIIQFMARMRVE